MNTNFSVPNPCHEKWDGMQPQENGRYCGSCQKVVVDFTTKTNEEILEYIKKNSSKQLCGTFKNEQLPQTTFLKKDENIIRFLAALLLVFGMSLFSCSGGAFQSIDLGDTIKTHEDYFGTITGVMIVPPSVQGKIECRTSGFGIAASDTSIVKYHSVYKKDTTEVIENFAEIMPEFNNGGQTLSEFIRNNLKYPDVTENNIGTVYISFVVMKDGSLKNIEVFKGFNKPFDDAALEVVKMMPKWKPGKNKGKKVNIRMYLPIKFK